MPTDIRSGRVRVLIRIAAVLFATIALTAAPGWSQTTLDWHVVGGGGGTSAAGNISLQGTIGQPAAGVVSGSPYALTSGFWAVVAPAACLLDVDGNGVVQVATDVVYIARHLLSLTPVPPSFRGTDPSIPSDDAIAARIDAAGIALDVDGDGVVQVATDIVYIARQLLVLAPVPPSFRTTDPTIPPDDDITNAIGLLCPP